MYLYVDVYVFNHFTAMSYTIFLYYVLIRLYKYAKRALPHTIYMTYHCFYTYFSYINFRISYRFLRFAE